MTATSPRVAGFEATAAGADPSLDGDDAGVGPSTARGDDGGNGSLGSWPTTHSLSYISLPVVGCAATFSTVFGYSFGSSRHSEMVGTSLRNLGSWDGRVSTPERMSST